VLLAELYRFHLVLPNGNCQTKFSLERLGQTLAEYSQIGNVPAKMVLLSI
jgi:hypothetical protein